MRNEINKTCKGINSCLLSEGRWQIVLTRQKNYPVCKKAFFNSHQEEDIFKVERRARWDDLKQKDLDRYAICSKRRGGIASPDLIWMKDACKEDFLYSYDLPDKEEN